MSSMTAPDVIVAGLGVTGAATLDALATRGVGALGLDRHAPPHALGSSHGRTRIIREAYYEHPLYTPLVRQARERWLALEHDGGVHLLTITGVLSIGPENGELVAGALRSAHEHHVPHEVLDQREIRSRFPMFNAPPGTVGVREPGAGLLDPEACVRALLDRASRNGARVIPETMLLDWEAKGDGVRVRTSRGEYVTGALVLALGAWTSRFAHITLPLEVERQVMLWLEADAAHAQPGVPCTLWEDPPGSIFATFPDLGHGVKAQMHHEGDIIDPEEPPRVVTGDDEARIRERLARFTPSANGTLRESAVCFYTNTPDTHFVIDAHPRHPRVFIASACSGHGFKFGPALGEILADLIGGSTSAEISPFRVSRFFVGQV
jgi:sarcosine oxidase